jgi:hypothetical protein
MGVGVSVFQFSPNEQFLINQLRWYIEGCLYFSDAEYDSLVCG